MVDEASRLTTLEANFLSMKEDLAEVKTEVHEVKNMLVGRPSWAIAALVTTLTSTTVGLAVALASNLGT